MKFGNANSIIIESQLMKNNFTLVLLTTIVTVGSIATTISTAVAGQEADYRRQEEYRQRERDIFNKPTPAPQPYRSPTPSSGSGQTYTTPSNNSGSGSYSNPSGSSSSYDNSSLDGLGELFGLFNFGPSFISSNGESQYGIQSKFGFENIRVRTGLHFGSGSSINGAFTYSLSNTDTMFNPFVGAGLGMKSIKKIGGSTSDEFSFYGTGGVDLKIADNFSITGAVNLPANSAYGTEFQAGINFFGSF